MAKIIYWNLENNNADKILNSVATIFNQDFDVMFLSEITSKGKGLEKKLEYAAKQYGKNIYINILFVRGTTYFGHGESIAVLSTVELKNISVLNVGTSQQSRDIIVVEFFGGFKVATFHLSCSNTAQKTSERQNIIQRLKNNEFQCAIGDWNTEPNGLRYRGLEILPPDADTTSNKKKLDYTIINENCQANGYTTDVLKFYGSRTSNHFPIKVEAVLN
ncbi:hypothetical protein [Flagellimonas sp. S3867]|uniref:hypothetical protein n=1 Tax=Flagellimonas sp. S3867 TaxID=2768063 RepID=UPI00168723DA|nr:hypothetical protein [Flagellimonas sp. S3867]